MSLWRRTAIEHLFCCKAIIEQATSPAEMWINLYHELVSIYDGWPFDAQAANQIYRFALQHFRSPQLDRLSTGVELFFEHVFTDPYTAEDVPNRMSASEFALFERALSHWLSKEEAAALKKRLHVVQHKRGET